MTLALSIAGAIAVAVTAKLMYLFFLSGKSIVNASLAGRMVSRLWTAMVDFTAGWSVQTFGYKLIAYPCMLLSMGGVSMIIYWLIPVISDAAGFWDKLRYCALIVLVGVSASMTGAFVLIYCVYLVRSVVRTWWKGEGKHKEKTQPTQPAAPASVSAPSAAPVAPATPPASTNTNAGDNPPTV